MELHEKITQNPKKEKQIKIEIQKLNLERLKLRKGILSLLIHAFFYILILNPFDYLYFSFVILCKSNRAFDNQRIRHESTPKTFSIGFRI